MSAGSLSEAAKLHADYLRDRSSVNLARAKSVAEIVARSVKDGVKTAQDNVAGLTAKFGTVASAVS